MIDHIIGWNCPNCSYPNEDSFFFTAGPMCEKCEQEFTWDDLLDEWGMKTANSHLAAYYNG